jgi:hypothetical protein
MGTQAKQTVVHSTRRSSHDKQQQEAGKVLKISGKND